MNEALHERIKQLEKAVRILASEPHETVVSDLLDEIFPEQAEAEERACRGFTQK